MAFIPRQKRKSYQPKRLKRFGGDKFYNSPAWRKVSKALRAAWIISHGGICPICLHNLVQMVDHVISRSIGGADFDHDNLLPMCDKCHNRKRGFEGHANGPLIPTKESATETKLVPVDMQDIIKLLTKSKYHE